MDIINKRLETNMPQNETDNQQMVRDLADKTKQTLRNLNNDVRYKYCIQSIVGKRAGQGI